MSDDLDPNKYVVLTRMQKKLLIILAAVIFLVVIPVVASYYYKFAINRPSQLDRDVSIEIKSGQGLNDIATLLYQKGLLNSEFLFKVYIFANHLDKNIQAGVYNIPAGTSVIKMGEILQHGTNDSSVTFTEGWRVEEYARLANQKLENIDYAEFVKMAKPYEGFLFPDTYFLNPNIQEEDLLNLLRETFNEKTKDILTDSALQKAHMTKEQAIILASIVEREVNKEEDRPIIAGILIKRWRNGELLGADATTQYATASLLFCGLDSSLKVCPSEKQAEEIDWWPNPATFTKDQINYDSPYNTRRNPGLSPAPICNPGLSAIKSVLNSKETPYNYYLTDSEGITHYAATLEEHEINAAKYLR